ncbi:hypothetical protein [Paraburkholderia rhynchosiae]|uniref:Uncharacterized protein n=1 Tax=Paraburkholderia rhynchosiae TaxID=487049 RepID=A0A2N7WSQ6_9BURK|nr:hypothetical protein [Paraburkholderia rhynchosiae]PMS32371.1 hypothetical protein C0Z16_07125 [Paraburkholderia rhynchosiae]CAB3676883.1 hypothetical protein LMG27174_02438 [Paraburkholderia rhynchosiae]
MLLSDGELARLDGVAPFLESEARTSLTFAPEYEVTAELQAHLQPGLRVRAPAVHAAARAPDSDSNPDPDKPPYPLNLFVGLPLDELRNLAHADDMAREAMIARFGATFAPRLLRAIETGTPGAINLDAGVQNEPGTLSVMLEALSEL